MQWHYAQEDERKGPVDERSVSTLIGSGVITRDTLVWRQGMSDWSAAAGTELGKYFSEGVPSAYAPPRAPLAVGPTAAIPRRDIALVVLFTIFSCGIYPYYLLFKWAEEINAVVGREKFNPAVALVSAIFTCGVAGAVFNCLYAFELEKAGQSTGLPGRQDSLGAIVTSLIVGGVMLGLIGLPVVLVTLPIAIGLIQHELNKFSGKP